MTYDTYYGMVRKLKPSDPHGRDSGLAIIKGVPNQYNRSELPLKLDYRGKEARFTLLGTNHTDKFVHAFRLTLDEYRSLIGKTVRITGNLGTKSGAATHQNVIAIRPANPQELLEARL